MSVSIKNKTRRPLRGRRSFTLAASKALPGWEVSLVFVGPTEAKQLNAKLRGKTYTPNVLSYVAGTKHGEIIICPTIAEREAPEYGHSFQIHLLYLFIHGLGHLAGRAHGATMERWEHTLLAQVAGSSGRTLAHESTHRHRH